MAKAPKHKIKDLLDIEGIDKELFTKAFEKHLKCIWGAKISKIKKYRMSPVCFAVMRPTIPKARSTAITMVR